MCTRTHHDARPRPRPPPRLPPPRGRFLGRFVDKSATSTSWNSQFVQEPTSLSADADAQALSPEVVGRDPIQELLERIAPGEGENDSEMPYDETDNVVNVVIEKNQLGMNMSVDPTGVGIQILEIKSGGALEVYNESVTGRKRVLARDFIIGVNNATDVQAMMNRIKADPILRIRLLRPLAFSARLRRNGKPWGLNLTYQNISSHVEIQEVTPGAVADYNLTVPAQLRIKGKDFIESINGMRAVDKIVSLLQSPFTDLDVKFLRVVY